MNTRNNEKLQRDLMRAIAVRALMNASGDNCLCPVKKPTKFIVTLKPVVKVPNADPFLNIQPKFSACSCNTKSTQKTTLTPEQIQVRNNTEALKGKTLLNAFRVLTNSKFISIDPQYNYGDSGILSPSCDKLRLSGGGWGKCDKKENVLAQVDEAATNKKECECNDKLDSPPPEKITLNAPQPKCSKETNCREDRMYRILQRSCHEKTSRKTPAKCIIVCPGDGYVKRPKDPQQKRTHEKEKCESKWYARRRESENVAERPTCVEKAVGTSDCSGALTPPQQEPEKECKSNTPPWDPLKYFGITCGDAKQKEDENCKEKAPCPLKFFPLPGMRTPKATDVAPDCQTATEPQQPDYGPPRVAPCTEVSPAIAEQPCPYAQERHYEPPKPRPPDISSEIIAQQCQRIHKLEQQVNEMRLELRKMKNEIIPPDDMLRCTALTSKLRELTSLLADLKNRHAEAIATVIMARKGATCQEATEHTTATAARAVSPGCATRAVSPERVVSPPRAVSSSRAVSPAYVVSPPRAISPVRAVSPARPVSPIHVGSPIRLAPPAGTKSPSGMSCSNAPTSQPAPPPPLRRPEMRAEQVQTCFADSYKDELSQTNTAYGWRPFIDEATQSSPPSTVRMTPKHTSSAPLSSHTSSATSAPLPCRHNTGEIPLESSPSFCPHCQCSAYPLCAYVEQNLSGEIMRLLHQHPPCEVLLSVLLQPNNIYHINISLTSTGEPLGCIYATEHAINEAVEANVFNRFLTFFIVDARISNQQKDKILAHTFEFFKN